jgi:hypothetical protein
MIGEFNPSWILAAIAILGLVGQHYMTTTMVKHHQETIKDLTSQLVNMRHDFNTRISRIEGRLGVPLSFEPTPVDAHHT